MTPLDKLNRDESGATATEYALIAALVSLGAMYGMSALGITLGELFFHVQTTVSDGLARIGLI